MRKIIVPAHSKRTISEVEFDRLLDAVKMAIEPSFNQLPMAANDNELAWPLIPFPGDCYGCVSFPI
jgi:hypothetical protein